MFEEKIASLKERFTHFKTGEERYLYLMELGKHLLPLPPSERTEVHLVPGCQSILYLSATLQPSGRLLFRAQGDALISAGLAALLISIYSDELPETILQKKPTFLQELGILSSLSPSRSNGVMSLYQTMQRRALESLHIK